MKKFASLFLVFLLGIHYAGAQLLTPLPAFPTDNGSVTITVDCTKGNQGLMNYSNNNDVYVHVGVITDQSNGQWVYVPFVWGTTPAAAKATYIGSNRYQYYISNVRTFFGVPAGETILKIGILFRNGSGSQAQRNADGSDMFVAVYGSDFAGRFLEPFFQPKFDPVPEPVNESVGDSIRVVYQVNSQADELRIYFNGVLHKSVLADTAIIDTIPLTAGGSQQIIAWAQKGSPTLSDSFNFYVAPPTAVAPLPPGVRDGINYEPGDTSATLVLFAPYKKRVSVIGDFNDWTETTTYQMNRTPDSNRYWIRIRGLTPGTEYAFQYLVDGSLRIADPYTRKVLDAVNDPYIPSSTYPNLKHYPTGKTTGITGILQTAAPVYNWQSGSFSRPDERSLVVYELLLRDFLAAHDWKTLKDTLSYFKELGINAIELMPVNEFEGNLSWGYNPSFYFAPDKYYGPANDMKAFIDACHQQGIAVIMDIALNHSFGQSPLVQLYWDPANNRPAANNPWFNPVPKHAYNVGYDMNHESPATHYFFSRVVEYWLQQFRIDGFRFDLSKGFTQKATCDANGNNCDVNAWSAYDSSRVAIWEGYYDTLQSKSPASYVILEHFAANSEEKVLSAYGMMLWGNGNYNFNEATMGYLGNSDFSGILHTVRGWSNPHLVGYMESHDEERLMYKNEQYGNTSGTYNIKDLLTGLHRNEMAAAFFFMMPGPKMIWQFGETGYDYSINYCQDGTINNNCRVDPKPIRWDYRQNYGRARLFEVYSALISLRTNPLFRAGFVTSQVQSSLTGAFKWLQLNTDTSNIVVVGNFDVTDASGSLTFPHSGTWYDYLSGTTLTATGSAQSVTLQPGEYHIYLDRNVTHVLTPVTNIPYNDRYLRLKSWPNPVDRLLRIEYELPDAGTVRISVCNLLGQQVNVLYNGFATAGVHTLPATMLSGQHLAGGTYFLQLEFNERRLVQKLLIK